MRTTITTWAELPDTPYYVTSTDTFMSGWGPARYRRNIVLLPCESREVAEIVAANARGRSEQEDVTIQAGRPYLQPHHLYSLLSRENAERWYTPGAWS